MAAIDDLRAAAAAAQFSLDGIQTDINTLKDLLAGSGTGGLTAAETAEALELVNAIAARTSAIDLQTE